MPSLCCRVRGGVHVEQIIRPGTGKTAREYLNFCKSTMKKTLMILLVALMLGGEARADAWREINHAVCSRQVVNVTDEQILEALPVYIIRASQPFSNLATSEMWAFFYNRGLSRHQQELIMNWIKQRANANTNPFEMWVLGCMYFDGYAGQLNKQQGIELHRANARLGYTLSASWLRYRHLAY